MSILANLSKNIINLPRYTKRIIAILIDIGICIICTWLAFYLRLEELVKINNVTTLAVEISILIAIPIFWLMGLYKTIFRFQGSSIIFTVFIATFTYALLYFAVIGIYVIQGIQDLLVLFSLFYYFYQFRYQEYLLNFYF